MKAKLLSALFLGLPLLANAAEGGNGGRGGGAGCLADFMRASFEVSQWLKENGSGIQPKVDADEFLLAVNPMQIQTTAEDLQYNGGPVDAYFDGKIIKLNCDRFRRNSSDSQKRVAAHEIFRKMGLEGDGYEIVKQISLFAPPKARSHAETCDIGLQKSMLPSEGLRIGRDTIDLGLVGSADDHSGMVIRIKLQYPLVTGLRKIGDDVVAATLAAATPTESYTYDASRGVVDLSFDMSKDEDRRRLSAFNFERLAVFTWSDQNEETLKNYSEVGMTVTKSIRGVVVSSLSTVLPLTIAKIERTAVSKPTGGSHPVTMVTLEAAHYIAASCSIAE